MRSVSVLARLLTDVLLCSCQNHARTILISALERWAVFKRSRLRFVAALHRPVSSRLFPSSQN